MKLPHLECLMGFAQAPAFGYLSPPLRCHFRRKLCVSSVKLSDDNDPLLLAATSSACLRYQETQRPEPLFVDPYAGCLVPPDIPKTLLDLHPYCLATRFIDDKLLRTVSHIDGLKQVVLLTDGMDTRPYRLNWPTSTVIFDISPERVFKTAAEKLLGVGADIPRGCSFYHIPLESSDVQQSLHFKGYNGNRASVWAIQGLPVMTLARFEEILSIISSLAMKGCYLVGELPGWLAETEKGIKELLRV